MTRVIAQMKQLLKDAYGLNRFEIIFLENNIFISYPGLRGEIINER